MDELEVGRECDGLLIADDEESIRFVLRAPDELARYIAHKGSICVDGTSLTVNAVTGAEFELNIIPQTMAETVFGEYQPGTRVNLEVDVIARYLERLVLGDAAAEPGASSGLSMETLAENGYHVYAGARKEKDLAALSATNNIPRRSPVTCVARQKARRLRKT